MQASPTIRDRVTYHAVFDESILTALQFAHDSGLAGVQVAAELPHLDPTDLTERQRRRIAAFCRQYGSRVSLHGPDDAAPLFATSSQLRGGMLGHFRELFDAAEQMGVALITLHPTATSTFPTDTEPRQPVPSVDLAAWYDAFVENLAAVIDLAAGRFTLCMENFKLTPTVRELIDPHLAAGRLGLCWDLPKTYTRDGRDETLEAYLWGHLAHIRQVHLHDRGRGRNHRTIGTGDLDFTRYLPRLAAANVEEFCIEVRPREKAVESLVNLISILDTDNWRR